jgi:arginine utilization protein RocB
MSIRVINHQPARRRAKPVNTFSFGDRTREISLQLANWPSVTGTPGEAAFSGQLADFLRTWPYFRAQFDLVQKIAIAGDPHGRSNVIAHVRGAGRQTIVLAGHYDVVPVNDYGDLEPYAWDPLALKERMIERLRHTGAFPQALADLESGAFLPGRGLLDMKSGLAAGLAVLERFAGTPDRIGNIVLVATPDEEDRSAGMRAAADLLPRFMNEHGLNPVLGINLDALCDNEDGAAGRVVALGCIGKLLLSALVVGKDAHACYPLDGVSGAYLAAELVAEMEFAPELGEETGHELASPPAVLGLKDLKPIYNVTTPSKVWAFWNVLTQRRSTADVLDRAKLITGRAIARAQARMKERATALTNAPAVAPAWAEIAVMTFAELKAKASAASPLFAETFDVKARAVADLHNLDFPTRSQMLTEWVWDQAALDHPAIILGIASMPYPAVNWPLDGSQAALEKVVRKVTVEIAAAHDTTIAVNHHLPIIADMSFLGPVNVSDLKITADATPIWGSSIIWDLTKRATPGIPMLNIGPWGRDYHHWLERVHTPYAFEVLPALVANICTEVLALPTLKRDI